MANISTGLENSAVIMFALKLMQMWHVITLFLLRTGKNT